MGKSLNPKVNHRIKLSAAAAQTKRHREGGAHRRGDSGAFNAKAVLALLAQRGCVGLRYYLGRDAKGAQSMVLVGVDAKGNNMSRGLLLNSQLPCPPYCPDDDALHG